MIFNHAKIFLTELRDLPECSEIGLLFGGYEMIPNRVDAAIKLYKEGKIKTIIVSGGIGYLSRNRKEKEANLLSDYLVKNGVREENIITEDTSRNTYQNVRNSYNIIKSKYAPDVNIVLITSDFHLRRCFMIANNFFNPDNIYGYSVNTSKYKNRLLLTEKVLLKYYQFKFKKKRS